MTEKFSNSLPDLVTVIVQKQIKKQLDVEMNDEFEGLREFVKAGADLERTERIKLENRLIGHLDSTGKNTDDSVKELLVRMNEISQIITEFDSLMKIMTKRNKENDDSLKKLFSV